jgi:hypothetical protein
MAMPRRPHPPDLGRCRSGAVRRLARTPPLSRPLPAALRHPAGRPPPLRTSLKRPPSPPHPLLFPIFSLLFPGHTSSLDTPPPPIHRWSLEDSDRHGISPELRRRLPSSVSVSLSLRSSQSTAPSLHPCPPSRCRTSPHSSTTTRATPPPLNAVARCRLRRLTIDPPF